MTQDEIFLHKVVFVKFSEIFMMIMQSKDVTFLIGHI